MIPEELRKRLEEAADAIYKDIVKQDSQPVYWKAIRMGAIQGAEWMFKECGGETVLKEMRQTILGQVANWLYKWNQKNAEKFENQERLSLTEGTVPVYTLMSDINKLWEGEK